MLVGLAFVGMRLVVVAVVLDVVVGVTSARAVTISLPHRASPRSAGIRDNCRQDLDSGNVPYLLVHGVGGRNLAEAGKCHQAQGKYRWHGVGGIGGGTPG
jgi:hypothetical protein